MLKRFLRINNYSSVKKRIIKNIFSLASVEMANYVLPLLTLPYLLRIVGPARFGIIAFAQGVTQYLISFTEYGFDLSASKNISINRQNREEVSRIFSSVMTVKFLFAIICLCFLFLLGTLWVKVHDDFRIFMACYLTIIGNILFTMWFFQGIEDMGKIAILNFLAKIITFFSIFIFIQIEADYWKYPLIYGISFIISGITGMFIIFVKYKIKIFLISFREIIKEIKEGWSYFLIVVGVSLYTSSSIVIVGCFASNIFVGYFAAAEKIYKVIQRLNLLIARAVYPHMAHIAHSKPEELSRKIKKYACGIGIIFFIISFLIFYFSKTIILILFGSKFLGAVPVLKVLAFLPFLLSISSTITMQGLLPMNYQKEISVITIVAGIFHIVFSIVAIKTWGFIGVAWSNLFIQIAVLLALYFLFLSKFGFWLEGNLIVRQTRKL